MRFLVTRSRPEAESLADELARRGHEALIEPLLEIRTAADAAARIGSLSGIQALLFTSANGVRAFTESSAERGLPAFAVGDSTAAAAREAGFARVESAQGDVEALADLVRTRLRPQDGALFHGAARQVAGDLKGLLERQGFALRRTVLYEAVMATRLSESAVGAIADGKLDGVLFFSPRTARGFVRLAESQNLLPALARCSAVCLSAAVADAVAGPPWGRVLVASRPDQSALLACLEQVVHEEGTVRGITSESAEAIAAEAGRPSNDGVIAKRTPVMENDDKSESNKPESAKPEPVKPDTAVPGAARPGAAADKPPTTGPQASGGPVSSGSPPSTSSQAVASSSKPPPESGGAGADQPAKETVSAGESDDPPALQVIAAFGGIRPMASKLGVAVSTVQGWRERAVIPAGRHGDIRQAAQKHSVALAASLLEAAGKAPEKQPGKPATAASKAKPPVAAKAAASSPASPPASPPAGPKPAAAPLPVQAESAQSGSSRPAAMAASSSVSKPGAQTTPGSAAKTTPATEQPKSTALASGAATSQPARPAAPSRPSTPTPPSGSGAGSSGAGAAASRSPQTKGGSWIGGFVAGAVALAVGFGIAVFSRDLWLPAFGSGSDTTAEIERLDGGLAALRDALTGLEGQVAEVSGLGDGLGGLDERLAALEARPAATETGDIDLEGALAPLDERVAALEASSGSGDTGELSGRLDSLDERLASLGEAGAEAENLGQAVGELDQRLGSLEQSVSAIGESHPDLSGEVAALTSASESQGAQLSALDTRVAGLEAAGGALGDEVAAMRDELSAADTAAEASYALALGQLRDALRLSAPYEAELALVGGLVGDDPTLTGQLDPLSTHASTGIPTLEQLRVSYPAAAREAAAAALGEEAEGLWSGVMRRVSQVVTVRPIGETEGDGPGAILARGEARLNAGAAGNLAAAVSELEALDGPAGEAMAGWLGEARARIAADAAVAALGARAVSRLGSTDG